MPSKEVFTSGPFKGVDIHDSFARAALEQQPIVVSLGSIPWPKNLAPTPASLGNYAAGAKITGPVTAKADVLIILYTENETKALPEVFTQDSDWSPARQKSWCGYAHNFAKFKPLIAGIDGDTALEQGLFGYLSAMTIGAKTVGIMNDTDDAFVFYAISNLTGQKPAWLSVRNASEPQIVTKPFPPGTPDKAVVGQLEATAGTIYGIYQYCTTLCSAFACWGVVAGL